MLVPRLSGTRSAGRLVTALAAALGLAALSGCSASGAERAGAAPKTTAKTTPTASAVRPTTAAGAPTIAPLAGRLRPDVLVTGAHTFSPDAVRRLEALAPAHGAVVFRSGRVKLAGHVVRAVAVDPSTFRRFTAQGTAESTPVWESVARGEAVVSHSLAKGLKLSLGGAAAVAGPTGPPATLRVGAFASTGLPGTDLIVDEATGRALGLPSATGVLLTAGAGEDPVALAGKVRAITGAGGTVDLLTAPTANPVAFLTGSLAAKAFGAFSYRYFPDGTIQPDPAWVSANIVTTTVPILGQVTCHRLMIPQLRGALAEIEAAGLASSLHTYDGCYVPKYIERSPTHAISLHTWGIAIDLDASTNYRGIKGTMNPKVVQIFKRWGFRWGGDWRWTDPMHFELTALISSPS